MGVRKYCSSSCSTHSVTLSNAIAVIVICRSLTRRIPVDAEDLEDLEDVVDHGHESVGDVHLSMLESLCVGDKLVSVFDESLNLFIGEADHRPDDREVGVDQSLELLQQLVNQRLGRCGIQEKSFRTTPLNISQRSS